METLVDSPLKGAELMKACLAIEPDLTTALDLMMRISTERKFRDTLKMTFCSLEEFDKHIQSLDLKDPMMFRVRILPTLSISSMPPQKQQYSRFRRWQQRLSSLLPCCSPACRSTPPTEQK